MIALLKAKKAGLLNSQFWLKNLFAGAVVGVVAVPLAMAFAIASGAKPEQGLYTAIIAGFIVAVFGGTRLQIAGPTGAFVVVLSAVTAQHGIGGLQIATMMAGVILLGLGVARLGSVIKFIPAPVILGFTAGIAVIIWVGQWVEFFGLPAPAAGHFHSKLAELVVSLPQLHPATTMLSTLSLALLIVCPRIPGVKRIPAPLIALVVATGIEVAFAPVGVRTLGSAFGGIPQGLPEFALPAITVDKVLILVGPAFTIAMLGAIESLLSAVVVDGMAGTRHDSNQELIGQGLANIVAPLFGGFAATGAIARTATNFKYGGTSPLAAIAHSATLLLILLVLAPLAVHVPLAVLAAILFVVAWNMSEARHFISMVRRAPRADVAILLTTFVLSVFTDLVVAVNIGVLLAVLQFLRRMAASVEVTQTSPSELEDEIGATPDGVLVFAVEGPFFFGAVETFINTISSINSPADTLIIRLKWVPFMDITGIETLEKVIVDLQKRGTRVLIAGANERVAVKLQRAGIVELVGSDACFADFEAALQSLS